MRRVKIVEVSPRDGLQNEAVFVPTDIKIQFINLLSETGLSVIETTSFVSPQWVPQLADHTEVFEGILKYPHVIYPVLVPNRKGLEQALAAGVKDIAVFTTPSETFCHKNTNCSVAESLHEITEILQKAHARGVRARGYLSCVLGCPYEGEMAIEAVVKLSEKLIALGCDEISLGDTIGVGTPLKTKALLQKIVTSVPKNKIAVHFHDTYGRALSNIEVALDEGIAIIDSSVGGLGGCPYAKGASGNVATEKVLAFLEDKGIETGIDKEKLLHAKRFIQESIGNLFQKPSQFF